LRKCIPPDHVSLPGSAEHSVPRVSNTVESPDWSQVFP
jgi:hypothetical protein